MAFLSAGRALLFAGPLMLPLGACVAGDADSAAGRASVLATTVSRAVACKAGSPRRTTLDRFLAVEKARGASDEQLAAARSAYVSISEAETINQDIRPQPCTAEERATLRGKMLDVRAGRFEAL